MWCLSHFSAVQVSWSCSSIPSLHIRSLTNYMIRHYIAVSAQLFLQFCLSSILPHLTGSARCFWMAELVALRLWLISSESKQIPRRWFGYRCAPLSRRLLSIPCKFWRKSRKFGRSYRKRWTMHWLPCVWTRISKYTWRIWISQPILYWRSDGIKAILKISGAVRMRLISVKLVSSAGCSKPMVF